jgi:xylulokinase
MSLLGIDVGTTGCKAAVFSTTGDCLASAYQEYDVQRPQPGWAELDVAQVWARIRETIRAAVSAAAKDPVRALAVSSLGEAVVPVSYDGRVLGPALLSFDVRGEEYSETLGRALDSRSFYQLTGNAFGNHYTLTKLKWIQEHQPALYERADKFLLWGSFVSWMLGAEPVVDYSLANRTLLFDLDRQAWSEEMLARAGLERRKLPTPAPSGTAVGTVRGPIAGELGLPPGVAIVLGAHDQCSAAVGSGAIEEGQAVYGMGTYLCVTPVFSRRREAAVMLERGLNTEHHALPGKYVAFIYNQGGALVKWFRDTFAQAERREAQRTGQDVYARLIAEVPAEPCPIVVLPDSAGMGTPEFIAEACGVMVGLRPDTARGDILKGILEGTTFDLRERIESLPPTGIRIDEFRAVGGGSKSDTWIRVCADILGRPFVRPRVTEAGTLGAAILAGTGAGLFLSVAAGVEAMVRLERTFEPDACRHERYAEGFERYKRLRPLLREYLLGMAAARRNR